MPVGEFTPVAINEVIPKGDKPEKNVDVFNTGSADKLREIERILGREIVARDLDIPEIQGNPLAVLEAKAKEAWRRNRGPIIVEDTSFDITAFPGVASYPAAFTKDRGNREKICRMLGPDEREAVWQVGLAIFDGQEVQRHVAQRPGKIADRPRGARGFDFDDIFIPDNQIDANGDSIPEDEWKTLAEMTDEEKDRHSARREALLKLASEPFIYNQRIFRLPEPYQLLIDAIRREELNDPIAIKFAYDLTSLAGNEPSLDFRVRTRPPYYKFTRANGQVERYVTPEDSPDLGMIVTSMDKSRKIDGTPYRLQLDDIDEVMLMQQGDHAVEAALASRTEMFMKYHNPEMDDHVRRMMQGDEEVTTPKRANKRSAAIETLLRIEATYTPDEIAEDPGLQQEIAVLATAATSELGYARRSSNRIMSRSAIIPKGLLLTSTGLPSSIYGSGGMPPVSGWTDVLATNAVMYRWIWAPRNSTFVTPDMQMRLVDASRKRVYDTGIPTDIADICAAHIGVSVGCEDPKAVGRFIRTMQQHGLKAARIYTTSLDRRLVDTAEEIRQVGGEDFIICVAPVGDYPQAKELIKPNRSVNIILAGHGAGENCTSLEGGGAPNGLELFYNMSIDPDFNDTAIGFEGGTGSAIGAYLGVADLISKNKSAVEGGIETGGLFVLHTNGDAVQPYPGSASAYTQRVETIFDENVALRRLNAAGQLRNVEGKQGYLKKPKAINTIVDNFRYQDMIAGRALADQDATSINELRVYTNGDDFGNHRITSVEASVTAAPHRSI